MFWLCHDIERHHGLKPDDQRYQTVSMIMSMLLLKMALRAGWPCILSPIDSCSACSGNALMP